MTATEWRTARSGIRRGRMQVHGVAAMDSCELHTA